MPERRSVLKGLGILGGTAALPVGVSTALSGTETITGTITGSDPTDPAWPTFHTEPYEFEASEGDTIEASLSVPNGGPWIHIVSPSGSDIVNSPLGQFETTAEETGTYTIYPQSGNFREAGAYTLELTVTGDDDGGGGGGGGGSFPIPIEGGETVSGNITGSDPTDPLYPNYHTEPYEFEASEGDTIEVSLSMPDAAPWIHLEAPSGQDIINEGTSGEFTREVTLEETGTYTLYPQAFPAEAPGQYTLTLTLIDSGGGGGGGGINANAPPAYSVATEALAASPTKAVFTVDITPNPDARSEYDGSVGGLSVGVADDVPAKIARIAKLPNEDAELSAAAGSLILSLTGAATGSVTPQSTSSMESPQADPQIAATTGIALIISSSIAGYSVLNSIRDLAIKAQQENVDDDEGTKTALFSGDASIFGEPSDEFFEAPGNGKYLFEIESTDGAFSQWGEAIQMFYQTQIEGVITASNTQESEADEQLSIVDGDETITLTYNPTIEGDLVESNPFVDHMGYSATSTTSTQPQSQADTDPSQQDEQLTEEESADSVVQKPTRQKPTPQMANSIVQQYDQNSDGEISVAELGEAGQDFAADELTIEELAKIGQEFANN